MKKKVAIIGSGPSALMLAAQLDETKFEVSIYEKGGAPARKFLVAGDGGFNLTHSEPLEFFISRYTPSSFFEPLLLAFSNTDLVRWLESIGIPTFIGSSKRIFPVKGIKPIDVLNAILNLLQSKNVTIHTKHVWKGWAENGSLQFDSLSDSRRGSLEIKADITVFALGGASWKVTGSDGAWADLFAAQGIKTEPFQASNCAFGINWPADKVEQLEGRALKNITVTCADADLPEGKAEKKGEAVLTRFGIEGGAVYALSKSIRKQLNENGSAEIRIDLKPALSHGEILKRLADGNPQNTWTKFITQKLNLNETHLLLLRTFLDKESYTDVRTLTEKVKAFPLRIVSTAPIDEAISTVGGISLDEIDKTFEIKKMPGSYAIGEMLDWDAPTGGYLLQGCFSMGYLLAQELNKRDR